MYILIWPMMGAGLCLLCFSACFWGWDQVVHGSLYFPTTSQLRRPPQPIPDLHGHLHSCHHLLSHPPGTGCSALQSPCCQQTQTHFTEKHVSQDLCCFQWLWEKMPILNKQNYIPQHQHPSASPPQRTPVLSVFGNLSGSPVLRHWQCIAPYLPLSFKHRRHLQVTGKTKIFI